MFVELGVEELALLSGAFLLPCLLGLTLCLSMRKAKNSKYTRLMVASRYFAAINLFVGNYIFLFNQSALARALSLSMILTSLLMFWFMYPFDPNRQSDEEEKNEDQSTS